VAVLPWDRLLEAEERLPKREPPPEERLPKCESRVDPM